MVPVYIGRKKSGPELELYTVLFMTTILTSRKNISNLGSPCITLGEQVLFLTETPPQKT